MSTTTASRQSATKKAQSQTLKQTENMTTGTTPEEQIVALNLDLRNEQVIEAYHNIIKGTKALLTPFDTLKYRMSVTVDHSRSGKETNLVSEFLCYFFNYTLTKNRFNYLMIYVSYDADAITRFGDKLFNKMLRVIVNCTNLVEPGVNIENCIRLDHSATDIQPFFINRLLSDPQDYITITSEEKAAS